MQRIDSDLSAFPRIGTPPKVKREIDIKQAANYYVTYQALVRRLQRVHNKTLAHLRRHNHEDYPYDIRILDKLLWMIGNPKRDY